MQSAKGFQPIPFKSSRFSTVVKKHFSQNVNVRYTLIEKFPNIGTLTLTHQRMNYSKPSASKWLWSLGLFVLASAAAFAQSVSGKVTDAASGEALPGVSVTVKGTAGGAVTDGTGMYKISADNGATLVFSTIGYRTKAVAVAGASLNVSLSEDVAQLEEAVVIGYGTVKKKDLTGSSASVSSEDFNQGAIASPVSLIQGKAAGVQVSTTNGEPGSGVSVRVRGGTSISSSNEPLYIIDGMPVQVGSTMGGGEFESGGSTKSALNRLNPADIESITVLKDASATAIYGARGANGVVLITTKQGRAGKMNVDYAYRYGVSNVSKKLDLLSSDEYKAAVSQYGLSNVLGSASTDWQDEIFQQGSTSSHDISINGGTNTSNYRFSLGYYDEQGVVLSSGTQRVTSRMNMNQTTLDGMLNLGMNMAVALIDDDLSPYTQTGGYTGGLFTNMMKMNPTEPVYNADGSYREFTFAIRNPVQAALEIDDVARSNSIQLNGFADLDLNRYVDGLTGRLNVGYERYNTTRKTYLPRSTPFGQADNGIAAQKFGENASKVLESYLNYSKDLLGNPLTLLAGYSWQQLDFEGFGARAKQFVTDNYSYNNLDGGGLAELGDKYSFRGRSRLISFFGRANYDIAGKYILTASVRRDGSSKFGADNKWGLFPSAAFAWRLSEEGFLKDNETITDLKLRAGWGVVGNEAIGVYNSIARIGTGAAAVIGGQVAAGTGFLSPGNPNLRWEQTSSTNFGVDFELKNGKIYGSLDYFTKKTTDLLLEVPAPSPSVANTLLANVGQTSNSGFDLSLNTALVSSGDLMVDLGVNFSHSNLVIDNIGTNELILTGPISGAGQSGAYAQRLEPGFRYGSFYGNVFEGYDANGNAIYATEQGVIGVAQPDFIYGLLGNVKYKDWTMNIFFRGAQGMDVFNNLGMEYTTLDNLNTNINLLAPALDNGMGLSETPTYSSQWIEDGSFLRLDNVTLGKTLNVEGSKIFNSAYVGLVGQNLWIATKYTGFDPELTTIANNGLVPSAGIDYAQYPRSKTVSLNLKFNFK